MEKAIIHYVNGISFLSTDEANHHLLDSNPVSVYEGLQRALLSINVLDSHYNKATDIILAIDPHRIFFPLPKG